MKNDKFVWTMDVLLYGGDEDVVSVVTDTEDWYEAEEKALDMPGVWDIGEHYALRRPDGTRASV